MPSSLLPVPSWITLPRPPAAGERVFWYPFTDDPVLHQGDNPLVNFISGTGTNITIEQHATGIPVDYPRADWAAIGTPPLPTGQVTQIYGVVQGSFTNVNGFASLLSPTLGTSFGIVGDPVDWAGIIITSFAGGPLQPDPTTFAWDTFDLSMHNYSSVSWTWDGVHPSLFSITDAGFLIYATVGDIVIEKVTVPSASEQGFDFTSDYGSPFTLHDGESNASAPLAPGTYSVEESPVAGWTAEPDSDPSSITVVAGETTTVIFTNVKNASIVVHKVTDPPGVEQGFEFLTSYGAPFTLHDGESNDSGALDPAGEYSILESPVTGWGVSSDPPSTANLPLDVGQTLDVTFTNTITRVIVRKVTVPPGNLEEFTLRPSWGNEFILQDGDSHDSGAIAQGSYRITEDPITGWTTEVSAVDQDDSPVEIGSDGTFLLALGQTVTITFTNSKCVCLDFTEAIVRDANDIEQSVAGGADGKLYLLYDGISDNGKYFTGEALALKYLGPQRSSIQSLEWYGDKSAEFYIAKELNTAFDSSQMQALGEPEEVQDDENSNHWRAYLRDRLQMIHAYVLMRLTGYEGGTMELNDPPHMPVETYGRVLLVSPQAGGDNPR